MLFMTSATFAKRMDRLRELGYPVVALDEAVERLRSGTLLPNTTVITIDDGFALTAEESVPILCERSLPATIYVTSYYAEKREPIFELVLQYLLWLGENERRDLIPMLAERLDVHGNTDVGSLLSIFARLELAEKREMCDELAGELSVSPEAIYGPGEFSLMNAEQIARADQAPEISIQLHTRRHRFPEDVQLATKELIENRRDLEPSVAGPLEHFCYPSGIWNEAHFEVLKSQGIRSATTTDNGLNFSGANPYALTRYLDSEVNTMLEFEAELSGFAHILRKLFGRA